jgi:hypothetical protein
VTGGGSGQTVCPLLAGAAVWRVVGGSGQGDEDCAGAGALAGGAFVGGAAATFGFGLAFALDLSGAACAFYVGSGVAGG